MTHDVAPGDCCGRQPGVSEAGVDLVLIQTFLLHHVNQVVLMLTTVVFFQGYFP